MAKRIFLFFVIAELVLVVLDATVNYAHGTSYGMIRRLCNIAREDGFASWFGTTQTFLVGLTLLLIFLVARRDGSPRWVCVGWLVLAIFFLYMAADDGAQIHERLGSAFKKAHRSGHETSWAGQALTFFPSYAWQIVFMPFFIAMGIFLLTFLGKHLQPPRGKLLLLAALALFSAAVVLDFIEGLDPNHRLNAYTYLSEHIDMEDFAYDHFNHTPYDMLRHFSKSLEEFLEMFSTSLLWLAFMTHFVTVAGYFDVDFLPRDKTGN